MNGDSAEAYRLADHRTCLVCGKSTGTTESCPVDHFCLLCRQSEQGWAGRFTWRPAGTRRTAAIDRTALYMGVSVAHATKLVDQATHDYTYVARAFLRALDELQSGIFEGHGPDWCWAIDGAPGDTITSFHLMLKVGQVDCLLCRFHLTQMALAMEEDHRHRLSLGDTFKQWWVATHRQVLDRRAADVTPMSIEDIVHAKITRQGAGA